MPGDRSRSRWPCQNGTVAGLALLLTLVSGFLYEKALRRTPLSWLPWAISFGLLPAFLSYGGWGGGVHGPRPRSW